MSVKFEDYTVKVQGAIDDKIDAVLEECAGELESQVKRNSRVDTGKTKNSFRHRVTGSFMAGQYEAHIGSDDDNSIYEELGTGEYALKGNGRKGGWFYEDAEGIGHFTHGKKPSRAFWNAYISLKSKIINHIQNSLKGL